MPTATYSPAKTVIGMGKLSRICEINLSTMTSQNGPPRNTEVTLNFISPSINDMETINQSNFNYNNFNTPILVVNGYKSIEPLTASRRINRISNKEINITNIITIPIISAARDPPIFIGNSFNFYPVSCTEIQRIIKSMPSNKSSGPDKVNMRVIKDVLPVILGPLTDIINTSLTTSTFPDYWKEAEVIPLLKEGDHEQASNNRPLSLLKVVSKVCEKVAFNQFSLYLSQSNHLSPHQSGNKKYHSTETLNILMYDSLLDAMDNKKLSALMLLDLSEAFDSINHPILLRKLRCVGASDKTVKWFQS